jgi:hypothetical protein
MNKSEFLSALELQLRRKNVPDIAEIIADYTEHFEVGKSANKSEQEIIIELGAVEGIVNEYLSLKSTATADLGMGGVNGGNTNDRNASGTNNGNANGEAGKGTNGATDFAGATVAAATAAASTARRPAKIDGRSAKCRSRRRHKNYIPVCAYIF